MLKDNKMRFRQQILLATLLIAVCIFLSACIGKKPKVYRIGIVSGVEAFANIADGFKDKMTELGYIEGKNIVYDFQRLNADRKGEERVAKKFIDEKVDLIFAFPTEPALAAKTATKGTNISVVFALAGVEGTGLVESVSHPGGNITGVRFPGPELTAKRLEILHELVPEAKRIGIIYDSNYPNATPALEALRQTTLSIGVTLVEIPVVDAAGIRAELEKRTELNDIGIDAILIMPDILSHTLEGFGAIIKFANEHKLPVGGGQTFQADWGAVFGYSPYDIEIGELAAPIADKIFKGILAGTVMVVTPPAHLWINYKKAQELGLNVSEGLLSRADKLIR
jgi:putative ABC transport system substrate-binding protein